jgi:hypothetical protein
MLKMEQTIVLTDEENKMIELANSWIMSNDKYLKHCKFTNKELIQIGKNITTNKQ